jgi:hypothetical protein
MGLNDQAEKIRQAEEWLKTEPRDSEHYKAALEHLGGRLLAVAQLLDNAQIKQAAFDIIEHTVQQMYIDAAEACVRDDLIPLAPARYEVGPSEFLLDVHEVTMWVPVREAGS